MLFRVPSSLVPMFHKCGQHTSRQRARLSRLRLRCGRTDRERTNARASCTHSLPERLKAVSLYGRASVTDACKRVLTYLYYMLHKIDVYVCLCVCLDRKTVRVRLLS